jgi:hypothetical protein
MCRGLIFEEEGFGKGKASAVPFRHLKMPALALMEMCLDRFLK